MDHLLDNTDFIPPCPRFMGYSFYARHQDEFKILPSNLWVTQQIFFVDADLNFYKSMMPKIIRCDIKRLNIHTYGMYFSHRKYGSIPFEYFKQFTAAGAIDDIDLCNTAVVYSDGTPMPFEEIYKCIPNATIIKLSPVYVNNQTMQKLNSSKVRDIKISTLVLRDINGLLNNEEVFQFMKDYFDRNHVKTRIEFDFINEQQNFSNDLKEMLKHI